MIERTIKKENIFSGRVLHLDVHDVELEDGTTSIREIIRHQGAIGVVAQRSDGSFLFVRQFRKAVEDYRIEIVAGLLDDGEDYITCARRELREETGYASEHWTHLGTINASPGYTSEKVELFYAADCEALHDTAMDVDERVELVILTAEEFLTSVCNNRIYDSKTLAAWFLYEQCILKEAAQSQPV